MYIIYDTSQVGNWSFWEMPGQCPRYVCQVIIYYRVFSHNRASTPDHFSQWKTKCTIIKYYIIIAHIFIYIILIIIIYVGRYLKLIWTNILTYVFVTKCLWHWIPLYCLIIHFRLLFQLHLYVCTFVYSRTQYFIILYVIWSRPYMFSQCNF